jgi:hypothetical protein
VVISDRRIGLLKVIAALALRLVVISPHTLGLRGDEGRLPI